MNLSGKHILTIKNITASHKFVSEKLKKKIEKYLDLWIALGFSIVKCNRIFVSLSTFSGDFCLNAIRKLLCIIFLSLRCTFLNNIFDNLIRVKLNI